MIKADVYSRAVPSGPLPSHYQSRVIRGGVSTNDLAERLGISRSNFLRWVKRTCPELGIPMRKGRGADNQLTWMWSEAEANRLVEERVRQGYPIADEDPA